MFAAKFDYFKVIKESLSGNRPTDEETFSSVAVLARRLERLKKNSKLFDDVGFSDEVEELASCEMISAIS
jgi:hypothetical protein